MIFHITSVYPPKLGGLEKVVQTLAKTQKRMGWDVSVITSNEDATGKELPKDEFPVTRLRSILLANTTIMPTLFFMLMKLKRDDIAHVHIARAYTPEMVWLASKFKHFSYIAHLHLDVPPSGPAGFLLKPYKKLILMRVLRAAKFVIVFTEDQKSDVQQRYGIEPMKVKVIPNGVEDKFYYDKPRTMHKKPRLLFVGRLGYQKNLPQLLHALDGISDQFETTIVGEGELEAELKKLAKDLKLQNVTFAGRKDGEKLLNHYKSSDIFVLSSEREGMPLVLLEAMAMGLPVVATSVTGNRDVIKNGKNGLLAPYGDAEAFREALLQIKSDAKLYRAMSQTSLAIADQYSWGKISDKLEELYRKEPKALAKVKPVPSRQLGTKPKRPIALWRLILPALLLANLAYLPKDFFGWIVTLGFFLLVPGYLLLSCLKHGIKSHWEIASFSLGLSLLILMVGGLALNSLHTFGLTRPLSTPDIFAMLDVVTLTLLVLNKSTRIELPNFRLRATAEQILVSLALTTLPLFAIGGAIRLNNGASNILTMILFATIPAIFVYLVVRKNLNTLYPYAIVMFGMAVLFSTSIRGWFITGHDIQHEFSVFHAVSTNNLWTMAGHGGDPYNACLSITILPTLIAKITTISAPYVYKVVFQVIFAFGLLPIYLVAKQFGSKTLALISAFVFITFPTFLDDMPFLNRQEIAFVLFGLLILTTFREIHQRARTALTIMLLFGLILSHYSSGYSALLLLLIGWLLYRLLLQRRAVLDGPTLPVLRLSIILTALLFTFLWNAQITTSTSNLRSTITQTARSLVDHSSGRDGFVQYSLLSSGAPKQSPAQAFKTYAGDKANEAQYAPWQSMPITHIGEELSRFMNIEAANYKLHVWDAKIFQLLLLGGVAILVVRGRKSKSHSELYFHSLAISCTVLLILWTVLPQISIDYTPIRLFQQTLVITALPIVLAAELLFGFFGRYKIHIASIFFALLFLDLSGFIPQNTGGYLPQLSLNNSGEYYDFFYTHKSDLVANEWLVSNKDKHVPVFMDTTSSSVSFLDYPIRNDIMQNGRSGYLYQEYVNAHQGVYRTFFSGLSIYTDTSLTTTRNQLYTNQDDKIFGPH